METPSNYVTEIESQLAYYDSRANTQKRLANLLSLIVIAAGSIVAFLSALQASLLQQSLDIVIAIIGLTVAVSQAVLRIWRFDETWILHRNTAELLRRELRVFRGAVGDYADLGDEPARQLFAGNVEQIIALEQSLYFQEARKAAQHRENEPAQA